MLAPRPSLAAVLRLDHVDDLTYRAPVTVGRRDRVFGGQLMAQALLAAGRTVSSALTVHQIHARFLRPAKPELPVEYALEPFQDRGSFAHRRVSAKQGQVVILELLASFHRLELGPTHQLPVSVGTPPEDLPTFAELADAGDDEATRRWWERLRRWVPVEIRAAAVAGRWRAPAGATAEPRQRVWLRSFDTLGDDPLLHSCAAVYTSDLFLLTAAMVRHGVRHDDRGVLAVTLNHSMWFHRTLDADDWWLYDQEGSWSGSGRVLCRGQMYDRAGRVIATTMQEGLLRVPGPVDEAGEPTRTDRLAG